LLAQRRRGVGRRDTSRRVIGLRREGVLQAVDQELFDRPQQRLAVFGRIHDET
jgi:hypothetical protein